MSGAFSGAKVGEGHERTGGPDNVIWSNSIQDLLSIGYSLDIF